MSESNAARASGADIWIAVGVVICLGLGASLTYWLSAAAKKPRRATTATTVQGDLINAPRPAGPAADSKQPAATAAVPQANGGADFITVNFDTLSGYYYEVPSLEDAVKPEKKEAAPKLKQQIPAPVKALDKRKIAVQGFMMPVKIEKGATKTFLLLKDQSLCCFGRVPRMNEWISVKMGGEKSTKFIGDQPVTVFGTLEVGEEIEKGEVLSIYRLTAEDVAGPLDL